MAQQQEGNPGLISEGAQGATHFFISCVCIGVMFSQRRVAFPFQQSHCPNANNGFTKHVLFWYRKVQVIVRATPPTNFPHLPRLLKPDPEGFY